LTGIAGWLALVPGGVWGQVALSPVTVVDTDLGTVSESSPLGAMINQSGVETPFVSGVTDFGTYFANPLQRFASSGNGGTNNWTSNVSFDLPLQGYVDFDLGALYRIDQLAIWNRSLKDFTVKVYRELGGAEQIAGSFSLFSRLSFDFSYAVDVLPFATPCEGRYVRLAIDSVHTYNVGDRYGYAIIGEVVASVTPITAPGLGVVLEPDGDVAIRFSGVLQWASALDGQFADVVGNPQSPYTIPALALATRQYFRIRP